MYAGLLRRVEKSFSDPLFLRSDIFYDFVYFERVNTQEIEKDLKLFRK